MPASGLAISMALRVASLDLCADEYLLMLARPNQVASTSFLSHDPLESALAPRARSFPANHGRVEEVVAQGASLLLATGGPPGRADVARRLGLRYVRLDDATTPEGVAANMARVAALLGDPARARPFARRLAALKSSPARPVSAWWLGQGGLTVQPDSLGARWMGLAGYAQQPVASGRISLEQLTVSPPRVLLVSTYRQAQQSRGRQWLDHPLVRRSPARRVATDGRPWTCAGPAMLAEVERLRATR